ncbi:MAG: AbrB/MazE/SpoVT family DNA-binding domain-containing protein [Armatimonadetes bacterium]|nr:AbrB/MazE/SpoVT family DNA-binding domain-containing protein [Armatimonadota bacterium]
MMGCDAGRPVVYGVVTVGERGQIVIPAEARRELGIAPGDKVIVLAVHPGRALTIAPIHDVQRFLNVLQELVDTAEEHPVEQPQEEASDE